MAISTINSTDSGASSLTKINDNFTDLDTTKADLASPTFTGTVTLPTGLTGSLRADSGVVSIEASRSVAIETTAGTTHSLTTTAEQVVVVWAKGDLDPAGASQTMTLKYGGVTKDTVSQDAGGDSWYSKTPFSLMYTETPGAATADITVETSAGSLANVVIIVQIIG